MFEFLKRMRSKKEKRPDLDQSKTSALQQFGLDRDQHNVNFVDIKSNYREGQLARNGFFQHISTTPPAEVSLHGLDPKLRDEVNFKSVGDQVSAIFCPAHGFPTFKFIFAFPCTAAKDTKFSTALRMLGWLEKGKREKYLYIFEAEAGTPYCSSGGNVNNKSEIMFPSLVAADQIRSTWKLDFGSKNAGPALTEISNPAVLDWRTTLPGR